MNISSRQVTIHLKYLAILFAFIVVSCNNSKQLPTITLIPIEASSTGTSTISPSVTPQPSASPSPKITSTIVPSATVTPIPEIVLNLQDGISLSYGEAKAAAWDSVGNLIVIASTSGLQVYDATSYQKRYSIRYAGMSKEIGMDIELIPENIQISPDGQLIAVDGSGGFQLFNITGKVITVYDLEQHTSGTSFSHDNTSVAFYTTSCAVNCYSTIELLSTKDGKQVQQFRKDETRDDYALPEITGLALSPDGKLIVTINIDNNLDVWDVGTGKYLYSLADGLTSPVKIAFGPDNKIITSISDTGILKIWDVNSRQLINTFYVPQGKSNQLFFYPDGQKVITGGINAPHKVLDIYTGKVIETLGVGIGEVYNFSPDGKFALISCSSSVCLEETVSGKKVHVFDGYLAFRDKVCFNPSGQILAVISMNEKDSSDLTIRFWDIVSKNWEQSFVIPSGDAPSMAFSNDGKLFAATSDVDQPIFIWDIKTGQMLQDFTVGNQPHYPYAVTVTSLGFRPNSDVLVIGNRSGIYTWDITHQKLSRILEKQGEQITHLDFSRDGETLTIISRAFEGQSPHIDIYSFSDNKILNTTDPRQLQSLDYSAYDINKQLLARITDEYHGDSGRTSALELWDTYSGRLLQSALGPDWYTYYVALNADNKLLAANGFRDLTIWDIEIMQPIAHLTDYNLRKIAFSPVGNLLAIIKSDYTVTLIDISQLSQINR